MTPFNRRFKKIISLSALGFFLVGCFPLHVLAEQNNQIPASQIPMINQELPAVRNVKWSASDTGAIPESILITQGTTQVLRFDRTIVKTAVSNPDICDTNQVSVNELIIVAKKAGVTNLIVWDEANSVATYNLDSSIHVYKLYQLLRGIDPEGEFNIMPFNDTVAVYGKVSTSVRLKQVQELVKAYDKNALSYVTLKDSKQILLEVRYAEITRTGSKDFKIDAEAFTRWSFFSSYTGQTGGSSAGRDEDTSYTPRGATVGTFLPLLPNENRASFFGDYFTGKFGLAYWLKLLETKNMLKVIARPNLVSKDGEEASFLVGGEIPLVVTSSQGTTINYQEYGTKLKFTPEVLETGLIKLKVETEVSEVDSATSSTSTSISVPGFTKRSYLSTSEMKDGQTMLIGGLIKQSIQKIEKKTPILGDMPGFKYLFKSKADSRTDVELLIIITPHVVKPFDTGEQKLFNDQAKIMDSLNVYEPTYPDRQADTINALFRQNEPLKKTDFEEVRKAKDFSSEYAKKIEDNAKKEESEKIKKAYAVEKAQRQKMEAEIKKLEEFKKKVEQDKKKQIVKSKVQVETKAKTKPASSKTIAPKKSKAQKIAPKTNIIVSTDSKSMAPSAKNSSSSVRA